MTEEVVRFIKVLSSHQTFQAEGQSGLEVLEGISRDDFDIGI